MTDVRQEVLGAAAELVAAFGAHDVSGYFDAFSPDATFLFHTTDVLLDSRAAYESLWSTWEEEEGFRVLSCTSTEQHVQPLGEPAEVAVFTHRVSTRVRTLAGDDTMQERETILFQKQPDGRWLAVHEHLSPDPRA